jgi:hypothetical protein
MSYGALKCPWDRWGGPQTVPMCDGQWHMGVQYNIHNMSLGPVLYPHGTSGIRVKQDHGL